MLILAMESSAKAASVALCRDGELLGQYFQRSGLTHSRTLLPRVEDLLRNTETKLSDVDCIAVAQGPGSFTGVRIGVSTAKGLCWGADKNAVGVSTLEAGAWGWDGEGTCCVTLRARGEEVYYALFEKHGGAVTRLGEESVAMLPDLKAKYPAHIFVPAEDTAHAGSAALCAWKRALAGQTDTCHDINPVYLKKTQAERMREEKNK